MSKNAALLKFIFITDIFPYPPHHGSSVISYHWIRCLSTRHSVSLLSCGQEPNAHSREHLTQMGVVLHDVKDKRRQWPYLMRAILSRTPLAFYRVPTTHIQKLIAVEVESHRTSLAVLIGPSMASLFSTAPLPLPTIFVPYDSVSLHLASRLPYVKNPIRYLWWWLEQKKWAFVERNFYPNANICIAMTNKDANSIARHWGSEMHSKIHIIPNGVDTYFFSPQEIKERLNHLVITGNMWAIETVSSIIWFLKSVLPIVQEMVPDVTLNIVGNNPAPAIYKAATMLKGVQVIKSVPDVRPYIAEASLYICPVLFGSGIKNRLLEAMAMGKAIVATPQSCNGLQVNHGNDLFIAEDEQSFAQTIINLLDDAPLRRRIGHAARQVISSGHSWEVVASIVERIAEKIIYEKQHPRQ